VLGINDSTTTQLLGFNVLILDSAPVTIDLESVTATVIDLYVYWKPGFMLNLEAWRSLGLSAVGVTGVSMLGLESVTVTVINLYVCWKRGFVLRLEAWLSSSLDTVAVAVLFNEKDTNDCSSADDLGLSLNH